MFLRILKQFKLSRYDSITSNKYPLPFPIHSYIHNNSLDNYCLQQMVEKGWNNKKLRFIINQQSEPFIEEFTYLSSFLLQVKSYHLLIEAILVFSRQVFISRSGVLLNIFNGQMKKIKDNLKNIDIVHVGNLFYKKIE